MNKKCKYLIYIFPLIVLISCSDRYQDESLEQKLDTTIVKVDIPLGDNYYDRNYTNRESKYYITIGTDSSSLVAYVRESKERTVSINIINRGGGGSIDSILFETTFEEFKYLLTEIEKDYFLDSLDGVSFPELFQEAELEKSLSEVYTKNYKSRIVKGREENYDRTEYVLLHSPETTRLNNLLNKYSVKIYGFSLELKFGIYERIGPEKELIIDSTNSRFIEIDTTGRPTMFIPYHTAFAKLKRNVQN